MFFESRGKHNTLETIKLALNTAKEKGIKHIVVPSCSGYTAKFFKDCKDLNVVCVTHVSGFEEKGTNSMTTDVRNELIDSGIQVLTTTHLLSGAERGISKKFGGAYPVEIMAYTLKMFGEGVKVCTEISIMALDAGLIPYDEPIIALGGTNVGADTAIIIKPSHASSVFDTKIQEIICRPLLDK